MISQKLGNVIINMNNTPWWSGFRRAVENALFGKIQAAAYNVNKIVVKINVTPFKSAEVMQLFDGKTYFDKPKPTTLLYKLIDLANVQSDDIILDFFSGSATTAHAVMQLNAEDGGNRKFIMVQLPEETDEKSEAYKAGYGYVKVWAFESFA